MTKHIPLVLLLSVSAACGAGNTGDPQTPNGPGASSGGPASTSPDTATAPSSTGAASSTAVPDTAPPGEPAKMKDIAPTEMAGVLKELGLDVKKLPPLNKIPPDKMRKVMGTFTKALGTQCTGCHDGDDFKKPTPKKKIAARMWNEFVRGYTLEGGGAVYCDSCHAGKMEPLVRDPGLKHLSAWMDENFVSKMKKTDGQAHSCETCHGDPIEGKFLSAWAK